MVALGEVEVERFEEGERLMWHAQEKRACIVIRTRWREVDGQRAGPEILRSCISIEKGGLRGVESCLRASKSWNMGLMTVMRLTRSELTCQDILKLTGQVRLKFRGNGEHDSDM